MSNHPVGRWLVPLLIVVGALAVGGGLLLREVYQQQRQAVAPPVTVPSLSTIPLEEQPGSGLVQLTPDAAKHPQNDTVRSLLQAYFDGINLRNFDRWKTSVTIERALERSETAWRESYRTTKNGSILVHRIDTAPGDRLRVLFSFTSTQDLEHAPERFQHPCIRWRLALPLVRENEQWKIAPVPAGTKSEQDPC